MKFLIDVNAGERSGNVVIIAAKIGDGDDNVKLEKLAVCTSGTCAEDEPSELGDTLWYDKNMDGIQGDDEPGVAGVTVQLIGAGADEVFGNSDDEILATQTTDALGNYLFTGLTEGNYQVQFGTPAGYLFTTANVGSDELDSDVNAAGRTGTISLASGQTDLSVDAGVYKKTASIGDRVWEDCNANGIQDDGELGVAGVTVKLLNSAGAVVLTKTTNSDGNYLFDNLTPGNYAVQFVAPTGYQLTTKDAGGNDNKDSDADPTTGKTITTNLVAGENDLSWDAGLAHQKVCITYDFSGNSSTDGTEGNSRSYSVSGVDVTARAFTQLDGTNWTKAYLGAYSGGLGVTNSNEGNGSNNMHMMDNGGSNDFIVFQFSRSVTLDKAFLGAVVGDSDISVWIGNSASTITTMSNSVLSSMGFSEVNNGGSSTRWADVNAGDVAVNVVIIAAKIGDTNDNIKLQNLAVCTDAPCAVPAKASVGDKVWEDKNHNDIQDVGKPGIGGVKVQLLAANGSTVLATTTTNSNGNYLFSDLNAGTYSLQFDKSNVSYAGTNMNNWMWASKDIGNNDAIDSDVAGDGVVKTNVSKTSPFTLVAGQNDMTRDAAITPLVIDLNGDGIHTISRANAGGEFDLFGNGTAVASGWINGSDGFLAVDHNGNGRIDDISEMFGGHAKGAGFAQLAAFDSNGDGVVDQNDARFDELRIWQDANGNHQTDDGELMTLAQAGIASLNTSYTELPFLDANDNLHLERSTATMANGSEVSMTDVYFNVSADDAAAAGVSLPSLADLLGDERSLDQYLGAESHSSVGDAFAANDAGGSSDAGEILRRIAAMSQHEDIAQAA